MQTVVIYAANFPVLSYTDITVCRSFQIYVVL